MGNLLSSPQKCSGFQVCLGTNSSFRYSTRGCFVFIFIGDGASGCCFAPLVTCNVAVFSEFLVKILVASELFSFLRA
jgi:hypothetical protein